MLRYLMIVAFSALMVSFLPLAARADDLSDADKGQFQHIISEQIAAFNADDGPRAYAQAAPMIQQIFPTADRFMSMVKQGYPQVYRQKSYKFGEVTTEMHGAPTQRVAIIDVNGKVWTALYSFEKQPDGSWKISGCSLVETPGADV